jgi:hypothetical protein
MLVHLGKWSSELKRIKIADGNYQVEIYIHFITCKAHISTQENFPRKENFVKCDWLTQIFRRKKILKLKINNDIFRKFSVRGNFS